MSAKIDQIIEQLKGLNLLEASELVKAIEETFGVSAAAPVGAMMAAPAAGGGAAAPAEAAEEQTEFNVILDEVDPKSKISVLKVVRTLTGLGLKEAKDLVESTPKPVKEGVSKDEAAKVKKELEEAGAKASIK